MERAETMARLLDVGYRMSLFPNPKGYHNEWDSVLSAAGAAQGYFDSRLAAGFPLANKEIATEVLNRFSGDLK